MTEIDIIEQRVKNLQDLAKETESKILKDFVNNSIQKCAKALTIIERLKSTFDEQLQIILQNEIEDTYRTIELCKNQKELNDSFKNLHQLKLYDHNISTKNEQHLILQARKSEATIGFFNALFREVWDFQNDILLLNILKDDLKCFKDKGYNKRQLIIFEQSVKIWRPIIGKASSIIKVIKEFSDTFKPKKIRKKSLDESKVVLDYLENFDTSLTYWIKINETYIDEFKKVNFQHDVVRKKIISEYNKINKTPSK